MASVIDDYTIGSPALGTHEDGMKVYRPSGVRFFDLTRRLSPLLFARGISFRLSLMVSFLAALLFTWIASVRLDKTGLYYDELHQAAPSFAYCGKHPPMFCSLTIKGIPVLNMNYSSAIKSGMYGLYLRCSRKPFSVVSWRLLGILMVGLGIIFFGVLARDALSFGGLLLFFSLLLTDVTVVLTTRHDWGPVALALCLRLMFTGFWIRAETGNSAASAFFLGVIASLSVFEKLSSLPLFLPLGIAIFRMLSRRYDRQASWCLLGGFLGAIPLLGINIFTLIKQGRLISFEDVSTPHPMSITGFGSFLGDYLSLGEGPGARYFILGQAPPVRGVHYLLPLLGLCIAYMAVRLLMGKRQWTISASLALGYFLAGLGTYLLPNPTWIHHWIIGTPFQYAALAIAFTELYPDRVRGRWPLCRVIFGGLTILLLACNSISIIGAVKSIMRDEAATLWHQDFTRLGQRIGPRLHDSVFIAKDWGVATQVYCFGNGEDRCVYQPYYYDGPWVLEKILKQAQKKICYLAGPNPPLNPATSEKMLRDMRELPGWQEIPIDDDLKELTVIEVRKFSRSDQIAAQSGE